MAIIKLVCQGCGANLDVVDDQRVAQCGYCGTSNQIRRTVHQEPPPAPPAPTPFSPPPSQYSPMPMQPVQAERSGVGRFVVMFVIGIALVPLLIGGLITYLVTGVASEAIEKFGNAIGQVAGTVGGERFSWVSARPFVADVNGDGSDDVIGTMQVFGDQKLQLVALSGSNFEVLWKIELGRRADLPSPLLRFEPNAKLLLFELGPTLHAYDAATGAQRWTASLPDKIGAVALDGEQLWVATIDEQGHVVSLADGKASDGPAQPSDGASSLRDDSEYDLIPELRALDLEFDQFAEVQVQQAFCADADLPVHVGRRMNDASKRCANPNGLAWVTRKKGTAVPFLIGYERASKNERWRVQLTTAGSLETVGTGFAQPRAEIIGDDAIVSFSPSSDNTTRVRRISLIDGATKWETTLSKTGTDWINGMVIGSNRVAVLHGQALYMLDLAEGRQLAKLGGM